MEALPTVDGKRSAAPPRIFSCDTCGALFPAQDLLEMHRSTMHPPRPQGRHRCAYCDFSRDSKSHDTRHGRTHTGDRPFVCEVCDKGFTRRWNLSRHMLMHLGQKPHQCPECGQRFSRGYLLARHRRQQHSPMAGLCSTCALAARKSSERNSNMNATGAHCTGCTVSTLP
ncbi:uncharacterized protein LOC144103356 [Amblyomma americanum]